jgi:hypothetical protein
MAVEPLYDPPEADAEPLPTDLYIHIVRAQTVSEVRDAFRQVERKPMTREEEQVEERRRA